MDLIKGISQLDQSEANTWIRRCTNSLRRSVVRPLRALDLYALYSLRRSGILLTDGWFRSFREQASIDAQGEPLPWVTYPAIEFLRRRLRADMSVFEYGSGGSTLWWAKRVSEVVSVEHDRSWFEKLSSSIPANVSLFHIELNDGGRYSRKIAEYNGKFDIVVVDGRDRVNCLKNSLRALNPGGVIVLDNSDRPQYAAGVEWLMANGFRKIEFVGMAPIVHSKNETAIFYRDDNVLGI